MLWPKIVFFRLSCDLHSGLFVQHGVAILILKKHVFDLVLQILSFFAFYFGENESCVW